MINEFIFSSPSWDYTIQILQTDRRLSREKNSKRFEDKKFKKVRVSGTEFHLTRLATTNDRPVRRADSLIRFSLYRLYSVLMRLCAAVLR